MFYFLLKRSPDKELPVITACPADIELNTLVGNSTAIVTYQPPTATDNSGKVTLNCEPPPQSEFNIGQTNVTCVAIDASGNSKTCAFRVRITGT